MIKSNIPLTNTGHDQILSMNEVADNSEKQGSLTLARILMIAPATVSVVVGIIFLISINTNYKDDQSGLTWLIANSLIEVVFIISLLITVISLIIGATIAHLAKQNKLN